MTIDNLKQECIYCYREVDASGLEGFRCTNKTVNKTTSWCRPKNANEPCSICEYCKPKEEKINDASIKALEQEPFKPMVEIDLYSVIKQKYIEREVLDKIREEIEEQVLESLSDGGDDWFTAEKVNECLDIIDKYRAESENKE